MKTLIRSTAAIWFILSVLAAYSIESRLSNYWSINGFYTVLYGLLILQFVFFLFSYMVFEFWGFYKRSA